MKSKRRGRRGLEDPLVPLDRRWLAASVAGDDRSLEEIAGAVRAAGARCSKQNLYGLTTREGPRAATCRQSLRSALARVLKVPVAVLSGEHDRDVGGAARTSADLNRRAGPDSPLVGGTRKLWEGLGLPTSEREGLPFYELLAYGLTKDLRKAGVSEDLARRVVRPWLSLALWQHWFVGAAGVGTIKDTDMDEFAKAAGKAVRITLRPLLHGNASVRDGVLEQMARALERVKEDVDAAARLQTEDFRREFVREHPDGVSGAAAPPEAPLRFGRLVVGPTKRSLRDSRPSQ